MNLIRHVFDTVQFLFKKYLFWAALSVAACGLSLIAGIGVCPLLAVVGWWLLLLQGTDCRCIAFSNCCWLWSTGLVAVGSGLVASQHVESSQAEIQLVSLHWQADSLITGTPVKPIFFSPTSQYYAFQF